MISPLDSRNQYSILIVDDHPVFCLGMSELINKEPDLTVCGSEETAAGAMAAMDALKPDLVIVDISLKGSNGIDLVADLKRTYPGLPVLVLSMYDESLYAERALLSGAQGYIMKEKAISQVIHAIRQVLAGDVYASAEIRDKVFRRLMSRQTTADASPLGSLTNRELEVFRLTGEGLSTKDIAARLNLSIKTVGTHRERIKEKFRLKNYTELVKAAVHWSDFLQK